MLICRLCGDENVEVQDLFRGGNMTELHSLHRMIRALFSFRVSLLTFVKNYIFNVFCTNVMFVLYIFRLNLRIIPPVFVYNVYSSLTTFMFFIIKLNL